MAPMGSNDKKDGSSRAAEAIRETQKKREQAQHSKETEQRLNLAKQGRAAYDEKNTVDAIFFYQKFLEFTARSLNVEVKGLHPKLFPESDRVAEALMIAQISLDLAKMFDHIEDGNKEHATYLRLVVLFSSGMPFQAVMADNVRKYIAYTRGLRHQNEFQAAERALHKGTRCFIATAAFESPAAPEVDALREFRDAYLVTNRVGRLLTETYYFVSPPLARWLDGSPLARRQVRTMLRNLVRILPDKSGDAV